MVLLSYHFPPVSRVQCAMHLFATSILILSFHSCNLLLHHFFLRQPYKQNISEYSCLFYQWGYLNTLTLAVDSNGKRMRLYRCLLFMKVNGLVSMSNVKFPVKRPFPCSLLVVVAVACSVDCDDFRIMTIKRLVFKGLCDSELVCHVSDLPLLCYVLRHSVRRPAISLTTNSYAF